MGAVEPREDLSSYEAPPGQIWVCAVCGRKNANRLKLTDASCWTWAVLCHAEKVDGKWMAVKP